jgi:hypothetical protein
MKHHSTPYLFITTSATQPFYRDQRYLTFSEERQSAGKKTCGVWSIHGTLRYRQLR